MTQSTAIRSKAPRGRTLKNNVSAANRYASVLRGMVRKMCRDVEDTLTAAMNRPVAENFFATDANEGVGITGFLQQAMEGLTIKWGGIFARAAQPVAETMVKGQADRSKSTLKGSILSALADDAAIKVPDLTGDLGQIYQASVAENVSLITSISSDYLHKVEGQVMRSITTGSGLKDLIPQIQQYAGQTDRRAANIARDQTRKAYNSINAARMQEMGVSAFEWIHSGGGNEPRKLHQGYNGKVFRFDDLPVIDERTGERGIPGQAINCGCTMKPVLIFDD